MLSPGSHFSDPAQYPFQVVAMPGDARMRGYKMNTYNRPGKREREQNRKQFPPPESPDKSDLKTGIGAKKENGTHVSCPVN